MLFNMPVVEARPPEPDAFETVPREDWELVVVPKEDSFGDPFPVIRENKHEFAPGEHYMPPGYAISVRERIERHNKAQVRRLQPRKDAEAERIAAGGNPGIVPDPAVR